MAEQICSNQCGTALLKAKSGFIPQKTYKTDPNWEWGHLGARQAEVYPQPPPSARQSQYGFFSTIFLCARFFGNSAFLGGISGFVVQS